MRKLLTEARLKLSETWGSFSRDPNLSQSPGLNFALFCITATLSQVIPMTSYNQATKGISLALQLGCLHFLLTLHIIQEGRDPSKCGREYFQLYGLFFLLVLVYSLPAIWEMYGPQNRRIVWPDRL